MKGTKLLRMIGVLGGVWVGTMLIYWFNLDNKLIFHVVRPMLNHCYDRQQRDVRL